VHQQGSHICVSSLGQAQLPDFSARAGLIWTPPRKQVFSA
jgi:hypothetical protein